MRKFRIITCFFALLFIYGCDTDKFLHDNEFKYRYGSDDFKAYAKTVDGKNGFFHHGRSSQSKANRIAIKDCELVHGRDCIIYMQGNQNVWERSLEEYNN